jgi:hypothetical protein
MNWKIFTTVCVSAALISFPQNIIGCGPDTDPYDYYTSFFHQNLPDAQGYKPFYYTSYNFLYDENEPAETSNLLSKEWAGYCGTTVTAADAKRFVTEFVWKDVNNLYFNIEKNQPLQIPDSVKRNGMTNYFLQQKDLEGLGYILYAKKVEPHTGGSADYWKLPQRDSTAMAKMIKNGQQLLAVAKKDIFKLKYTYQILRLAHYSGRYADVIKWSDDYGANITGNSILQPLCVALKAGALYKTGNKKEAAYLFSKAFSASVAKRVSNYLGFKWSANSAAQRSEYLQLCKNNTEKAGMLGLFALGTTNSEINTLKEIYNLNAGDDILEVLTVREINKLEEQYLTPLLQKEKGGKGLFYNSYQNAGDSTLNENSKRAAMLMDFLHGIAAKGNVKNKGLFETGAAYIAYILKDYTTAKKYLAAAEKMDLTQKVKDQWALTNILVTINEKEKIDAAFEERLLPSIQWLEQKAKTENPIEAGYSQVLLWKAFYRNLMNEVLARRYHQQGEVHKEVLCIGAADKIMKIGNTKDYYDYNKSTDFLRTNLVSRDVEKLFALIESKQPNKFEAYLITNNVIKKTAVIDFAGTAYLRDYDYTNAIAWFKKQADKKDMVIGTNPFIDLLSDNVDALPQEEKFTTTKLAFAQEMQRLQKLSETDKVNAAKHLYKIALGFYNMTYYGHAWKLTQYYRSGIDGYYIPDNATAFTKEYYGCFKAHDYFKKAMDAGTDKNFKARCLFMMAKCSQKQIHQPQYYEFTNNYNEYDAAGIDYFKRFKNNNYFPQLKKEYGDTKFYEEAFSSCSYLRDFDYKNK